MMIKWTKKVKNQEYCPEKEYYNHPLPHPKKKSNVIFTEPVDYNNTRNLLECREAVIAEKPVKGKEKLEKIIRIYFIYILFC